MLPIKNIIFDLGGVILNIDYHLTRKAFENLGISNAHSFYTKEKQVMLFDRLETGQLDEKGFIAEIQSYLPQPVGEEEILEAWNAMLLDFPLRRLQILQQLQLHYRTFLLSNTNVIHERAFNKVLFQTCGMPNLSVFFDKVYLSHRIGLRKPDIEVFKRLIQENDLHPEETLFLDDSPQHLESAAQLGIQTRQITSEVTIETIFQPK